ncbi:hypothetical protein [Saccharothrix sp. ST-888]|uniref:hypothetical protein n=1 Tax=Saccharothrix sp. ST-888 TaxID=1427391 RepID=UPI0005ECC7CC|nr:hypothetical protein [Saccharothrix sp. ST-888]KJK55521.1 hypothetical protein UK12_28055 [Saccharothrix sp. ST-888]
MISRTSRYQTNALATFVDRHGNAQIGIVYQPPTAQRLTVRDYRWRDSDRVDTVAYRYYQAEDAWWMYARANPQILDWTRPSAGTAVMIPSGMA